MIGSFISGNDIKGSECEGIILDKVLCLQTISIVQPGAAIGTRPQSVPIPLEAYLVHNKLQNTFHLVNPIFIKDVVHPDEDMFPVERKLPESGTFLLTNVPK